MVTVKIDKQGNIANREELLTKHTQIEVEAMQAAIQNYRVFQADTIHIPVVLGSGKE